MKKYKNLWIEIRCLKKLQKKTKCTKTHNKKQIQFVTAKYMRKVE